MSAARVVADILRTPTIDDVTTSMDKTIESKDKEFPAVNSGNTFEVTGVQGLNAPGYQVDASNNIVSATDPAQRVEAAFVLPRDESIEGTEKTGKLSENPVSISVQDPDEAFREYRTLLVVLQDTASGARNVYKKEFAVKLPDSDGDLVPDEEDAFPNDPDEWADVDNDGTGNNADPDDDNDGLKDEVEIKYGLNPRDPSDAEADFDGDGVNNKVEIQQGTDINDPQDHPYARKPGDINGDSDITLSDALLGLQIIMGKNRLNKQGHRYADVNSDNVIGPEEVVYILRHVTDN